MFDRKYEDRLKSWSCLRQELETCKDPYQRVIEAYMHAPRVSIHTDPWDKTRWPDPWELIHENQYCDFCTVLGMCYSLQLTDRFSHDHFEIHIGIDKQNNDVCYLLVINKSAVLGWCDTCIDLKELPKSYSSQRIYQMPPIQ